MTPSSPHISAFHRGMATGALARFALAFVFVSGLAMLALRVGHAPSAAVMVAGAGGLFAALTWRSMKVSREAMSAAELLAQGDVEEAERMLGAVIRRFSLYPGERVVDLYHLAVLRQGQGRAAEATELAGAVVSCRVPGPVANAATLICAEAGLDVGNLGLAHQAIVSLSGRSLTLEENLRLLAARCRYEVAIGAWDHLLYGMGEKVALASLMPPQAFANVHLGLARAARQRGREELGRWLVARAMAGMGEEVAAKCGKLASEAWADLADWMNRERELAPGRAT